MLSKNIQALFVGLSLTITSRAYTWPDAIIDPLELLYNYGQFSAPIIPCNNQFGQVPGTQTAAEWLRTAFHDAATADVSKGIGGIDGSLAFELKRPENANQSAFPDTIFDFFSTFRTPKTPLADLIALGAALAVRSCGGPDMVVPFRAGRVDAAGPSEVTNGVPVPTQDLPTHTADFARFGFNLTDMIGLVACGHTIGGVHGEDFPEITSNVKHPDMLGQTDHFDSSFDAFDNRIATQFISNHSVDPLVIGADATNSDLRIFNADNRVLMSKFAKSNELFLSTCTSLLERMINIVPKGVELSEVITPIPVKPMDVKLEIVDNALKLALSGQVRIFAPKNNKPLPSVTLHVNRKDGSKCTDCQAIPTTYDAPTSDEFNGGLFGNFSFFNFDSNATNTNFPVAGGFSSFTVEIKENDGSGKSQIANNNGHGFPIDDSIIFQFDKTCLGFNGVRFIDLAVKDSLQLSALSISWLQFSDVDDSPLTPFVSNSKVLTKGSAIGHTGYTTWTSNTTFNPFISHETANSDYTLTGKDVHGHDFKFVGISTDIVPKVCQRP